MWSQLQGKLVDSMGKTGHSPWRMLAQRIPCHQSELTEAECGQEAGGVLSITGLEVGVVGMGGRVRKVSCPTGREGQD